MDRAKAFFVERGHQVDETFVERGYDPEEKVKNTRQLTWSFFQTPVRLRVKG